MGMFCRKNGEIGEIEKFMNGQTELDSPLRLFAASVLMTIPALMVFLSLVLRPRLNRWLNIVFGIFYTAIVIIVAFYRIDPWWIYYLFLSVVESLITLLIVWYAWKWK